MINTSKLYKLIYIILFTLVGILIYQSSLFNEKIYEISKPYNFSNSWKMSIEGTDIKEIIDLPYFTSENSEENTISIENTIPNNNTYSPHIRVGSSQQSFKVYIENELIYSFNSMRSVNHGKTGGAVWRIIELPSDSSGKTIRIDFKSSYLKTAGYLSKIKLGTKNQLLAELFFDGIIDQMLAITLLILSIFIMYVNIKIKSAGLKPNHIYLISIILCISVWISVESQFYVFIYNNYVFNYYIQFIALFLFPIVLYKYLILEYDLKPRKLMTILYKLHIYLMLLLIIFQLIGFKTFFEVQWIFLIVFSVTFLIIIICIIRQVRYNLRLRGLVYILVIIFICLILDSLLYDIKGNIIKFNFINIGIIIVEILIGISTYKSFLELKEEKEKSRYLECQLSYQLKHYLSIEEKNLMLKRYRHDMTNHWILVNRLIKNNKFNIAEEYSSKMADKLIGEEELILDTGNPILDAILTEKIQKAKSLNIDFLKEIIISKGIKIDPIDCCIIFGNILDNAIEACVKLENKRYIEIKLNSKGNMLICKVRNSINSNEPIKKGYKTTKRDENIHGFGITNIKKSIEKYNGYIDISHSFDYFEISFILYDV